MKKIHNGSISLVASGRVTFSGGGYPQIEVNGDSIERMIGEELGIGKDDYSDLNFNGRVSIVLECTDEQPDIKNTMVEEE